LKAVGMAEGAGAERRMNGKAYTFLEVDLAELVHPRGLERAQASIL